VTCRWAWMYWDAARRAELWPALHDAEIG
jgi:hypothetical protein